jgi:type IV pilus assembly protein PilC
MKDEGGTKGSSSSFILPPSSFWSGDMPTYKYEAMDTSGGEVKDSVEAVSEEEAQQKIRQMGYFVTKITEVASAKKGKGKAKGRRKKGKTFTIGGVSSKALCTFTRQFSTLQDAGLPVLRSLKILEHQMKPGVLKNALIDVVDDVESGSTLSEAFGKHPKCFDRLYVNMVKAGEAGGALEVILQRLADFKEKAQSLKRKITGAMIYPVVVILVAVSILTFIMVYIIPKFEKIFKDFNMKLPWLTVQLMETSRWFAKYWYILPLFPLSFWLLLKLMRLSRAGNYALDRVYLWIPIIGTLIEKSVIARTSRTLGTLVSSGVPILESLSIVRETCTNAVFERMYQRVYESIREGDTIAQPLKESRLVDDMVVNMVDVGEETGDLDSMLYKVADVYDEEVNVLVEGMISLLEPLMIVVLGLIIGTIVIALFMPLIGLLEGLSK